MFKDIKSPQKRQGQGDISAGKALALLAVDIVSSVMACGSHRARNYPTIECGPPKKQKQNKPKSQWGKYKQKYQTFLYYLI